MSNNNVTIVETTDTVALIRIDLTASNRTLERELLKALRPYRRRLPKHSQVRQGLQLCIENPRITAGEASRRVCNSDRLARRIAYWVGKVVTGGSQ
jgi:hypothetical protein